MKYIFMIIFFLAGFHAIETMATAYNIAQQCYGVAMSMISIVSGGFASILDRMK